MLKILVVDDDPDLLHTMMVSLTLEWSDAWVIPAADGEDGLDCFRKQEPDLVLLDVGLPGRDGFEVLRKMRAESDLPIVMLTARGADADVVQGLETNHRPTGEPGHSGQFHLTQPLVLA
jgi:DNA-binding response OmpR family regulator